MEKPLVVMFVVQVGVETNAFAGLASWVRYIPVAGRRYARQPLGHACAFSPSALAAVVEAARYQHHVEANWFLPGDPPLTEEAVDLRGLCLKDGADVDLAILEEGFGLPTILGRSPIAEEAASLFESMNHWRVMGLLRAQVTVMENLVQAGLSDAPVRLPTVFGEPPEALRTPEGSKFPFAMRPTGWAEVFHAACEARRRRLLEELARARAERDAEEALAADGGAT